MIHVPGRPSSGREGPSRFASTGERLPRARLLVPGGGGLVVARRALLGGLVAVPLAAALGGCRKPETPLAHLYGEGWVHGAYAYYGKTYLDLQTSAEEQSEEAYRVLAQKGITALDGLQSREVPFHIQVDPVGQRFGFERDVPDTLMFRADMSEADRKAATSAWEKAREHIQTDYVEIRRLEWALERLLQQQKRIRNAIESTRDEQFRLTQQVGDLAQGTLPFPLPYQVTSKDYETVLLLLVERLEDDRRRLGAIASDLVAVGLTVRATDAGSASLSANVRKVLVAILTDSDEKPRPVDFPTDAGERDRLAARGRELMAGFLASGEYAAWVKRERDRQLEQVGALLSMVDHMTGLPASKVFHAVLEIWGAPGDYLTYLKAAASFAPGGSAMAKVLGEAIGLTEKVREGLKAHKTRGDAVLGALLNRGTEYANQQIDKQLAFFHDQKEETATAGALDQSKLMKAALPRLLDAAESAIE